MDRNNRPQGRQKYVTDNSKGTARRGEGLNTGPVGSGSRPGQQPGGDNHRTTRSSGRRSPIIGIAVLLLILLGGGGGLFGGDILSGESNGSSSESYSYSQPYSNGNASTYGSGNSSPYGSSYSDLLPNEHYHRCNYHYDSY